MIRLKFVILFSQMSKKNICLDLLEYKNHEILKQMQRNIISKPWFKNLLLTEVDIDSTLLKPVIPDVNYDDKEMEGVEVEE